MASNKEVKEGYASTLQDLTFNSKPLINVLTMLAEENSAHAKDIVEVIETYLQKVRLDVKLPVLYLIDCIMKNVGAPYTSLFCQNLVSTFCTIFEMVDERTRAEMFKLRQTWNEIIPSKKLYALDVQIRGLDPAWPVTAPPPTSSIYFNPKFLKNTQTPAGPKKEPSVGKPTMPPALLPNQPALDPVTLDMQKKLIQKQQELLELQQKKIELELLQTQVKLQEQLKSQPLGLPEGTNIHLKPEVAKSLHGGMSKKSVNVPSVVKPKLPNNTTTTRINPVGSGLASARPSRDPRLLRHQAASNSNAINSNIENKNISPQSIDNKDVVSNKMSVRDSRIEPRLANNKDTSPPNQGKAKALPRIPKTTKHTDTYKSTKSSSSTLSSSSSRSTKNEGVSSKSSSSNNFGSPSKKSQDKSVDSKNRSPSKSSSKHKKSPSKSDKKTEKSSSKSSTKSDKDSKASQKSEHTTSSFKDVKGQMKNRNYIRRNRAISISPEPSYDINLRVGGPPEKVPRLQGEPNDKCSNEITSTSQGMDVDLKKLPGAISKKRLSTDTIESTPPKKSKTELMDELFGTEDTDLRVIPPVLSPTKPVEKPMTPPPPIISDKINLVPETNKENKKDSPESKKNFDLVRAKLADATKREKLLDNDKVNNLHEDVDLRNLIPFSNSGENRQKNQIFISPDEEHVIKSGNMTKAQESALASKIFAQLEHHKLMEAKRKDKKESEQRRGDDKEYEHRGRENIGNISLQPISDEELDGASSELEDDFHSVDRSVPPPPNINQADYGNFQHGRREQARMNWRGRRGGRHPGALAGNIRPNIRGTRPEPWLVNQVNPWRPIIPPFVNQQMGDSFPALQEVMDLGSNSEIGGNSPLNHENSQDTLNLIVCSANQDNIKSINIDGIPRDIRYYDETAVAFMNWDDPREISFHNGSRRVIFDEKDTYIFNFNEPYRDIVINGNTHRVRLGGPTREIYIDGNSYECYFGGPGISVELDGTIVAVKMDGPPPQVRIGSPRSDLVGGKINLIVDAKHVIPIFLDGKVQKFEVDGKTHTLQFTDALQNVLINDIRYKVEFGGLPKPIVLNDNKHFIRFSVLPKGVKPGYVNIKDMKGSRLPSPVDENTQDSIPAIDPTEPALPIFNKKKKVAVSAGSPDHNSNSSLSFQNLLQPNLAHLDVLSSVMASTLAPATPNMSGYSVANVPQTDSQDAISNPPPPVAPAPLFNINDLFQKLVATGIVTTTPQEKPAPPTTTTTSPSKVTYNNIKNRGLKPVTFEKCETLKTRQPALIQILHSGMQCSSCGMRFPPEHSKQYSQHLDWHFRQNRKGKKNIRKAASRRWYYTLSDWKNYEEVEDLEEKEKNYFDQQQAQGEGANNEEEEEIEIPSVVADRSVTDPRCEVCQDKFEQFYNEEKEEWHLRMAIRVDDKTYHPLCYDDYLASLEVDDDEDYAEENSATGFDASVVALSPEEEKVPEEIIIDDDDEEAANNKQENVEELKTEQMEVENAEQPVTEEETAKEVEEEDDDDDDVIIHEVVPERIILDDDDCTDDVGAFTNSDTRNSIKEEPIDDGFMDVGEGILKFDNIKIKTEPIDKDDSLVEMSIEEEQLEEHTQMTTDTTHPDVVPLIDGNVQFESGVMPPSSGISGKIKINITKPIPVLTSRDNNKELVISEIDNNNKSPELVDPSQPLPPGEESIQLNLKPALQGLKVKKLPPVKKGHELTGLCSIM